MSIHYKQYIWKEGFPVALGSSDPALSPESFKVISDPYRKRISIEKYHYQEFEKIIYDSALLSFKDLKKPEQTGWDIKITDNKNGISQGWLRNQDDRLIAIETYQFDENLCRACKVHSPHGFYLSVHRMYYTHLGDPFDGVILFDANDKPVMFKRYEFDKETCLFSNLMEEQWDMESFPLPLHAVK
jgi:hypothetical protein